MSIYTDTISKLIQEVEDTPDAQWAEWDEGYIDGLTDARDAVANAEEELQRRLPAIYEEYGVPLT